MKILSSLILCLCTLGVLPAQQPFSRDEALKQLYHDYDVTKKTAQWVCTDKQNQRKEGWPCSKEYSTVSISVQLMGEVNEADSEKVYLVASAAPANAPLGFDCHACAPAMGVSVFTWQADHWLLQSANASIGFWGGWGGSPGVDLMTVGQSQHGLMLSLDDEGQGYSSSYKVLLVPIGKTVSEVWSIGDEQDDFGAYDPTDKYAEHIRYRSSAAVKFVATNENNEGPNAYFDIEVISRGEDRQDAEHPMKHENWTEIYRFYNGKYNLLRHLDFVEGKSPQSPVKLAQIVIVLRPYD
jgi:hypothetical protein